MLTSEFFATLTDLLQQADPSLPRTKALDIAVAAGDDPLVIDGQLTVRLPDGEYQFPVEIWETALTV